MIISLDMQKYAEMEKEWNSVENSNEKERRNMTEQEIQRVWRVSDIPTPSNAPHLQPTSATLTVSKVPPKPKIIET